MTEPTPKIPLPENREPRYCPACGTRVADLATTCLICGAELDGEEEAEETALASAPEPRFRIPWGGLLAGVLTALVFLAAVGWLVRAQMVGMVGTPTPTTTATATLRPTRPPRPTDTPLPTLTFTPVPPRVHTVQAGETCVSVATVYGITLDLLLLLNPDKCGPAGIIRPGDPLLIPAATPTPGPAPTVGPGTPSPEAQCPIFHVVQLGETGIGIAEKYGVPFDLVQRANPQVNFEQLPVNQVLQVPCPEPTMTPVPTLDLNATPTPIPKYTAPALLSPPDGSSINAAMIPLQWTAVSLLREDEYYAVRLRRLDTEAPLESILTKATLVRLGEPYVPTADSPQRLFSWEVMVVRERIDAVSGEVRYSAASHTSQRRTFRWLYSPAPTGTVPQTPVTP